jgi:hypothetical protein
MSDHLDCDTDHYLVVAKIRVEIVNIHGSHKFLMEKFNPKTLNEVESKEKYRVEVSNRFATSEYLDAEVEIKQRFVKYNSYMTYVV